MALYVPETTESWPIPTKNRIIKKSKIPHLLSCKERGEFGEIKGFIYLYKITFLTARTPPRVTTMMTKPIIVAAMLGPFPNKRVAGVKKEYNPAEATHAPQTKRTTHARKNTFTKKKKERKKKC